jgi:uncharacterized protein YbjT (DUF2867 family)
MVERVLLIGATGLIGGELLKSFLSDESIQVVAPTRRPLKEHPRLENPQFSQIDELDMASFNATKLYCCFGSTKKRAGSFAAFEKLEMGFMQTLLVNAKAAGIENVAIISSMGADADSSNGYLRVKGEIEILAQDLHFRSLYILKPSLLLGERSESRPLEAMAQGALAKMTFLSKVLPKYAPVKGANVSQVMQKLLSNPRPGVHLIENELILNLAK